MPWVLWEHTHTIDEARDRAEHSLSWEDRDQGQLHQPAEQAAACLQLFLDEECDGWANTFG